MNEQMIAQPEQSLIYLSITRLKLVGLGMLSVKIKVYICGEKNTIGLKINNRYGKNKRNYSNGISNRFFDDFPPKTNSGLNS